MRTLTIVLPAQNGSTPVEFPAQAHPWRILSFHCLLVVGVVPRVDPVVAVLTATHAKLCFLWRIPAPAPIPETAQSRISFAKDIDATTASSTLLWQACAIPTPFLRPSDTARFELSNGDALDALDDMTLTIEIDEPDRG